MLAPTLIPINNTIKRFKIGPALPTAASALSPTYFPTTTLSTVLYNCCAIFPISIGTVKIRMSSHGRPTVISTGANNFFNHSIISLSSSSVKRRGDSHAPLRPAVSTCFIAIFSFVFFHRYFSTDIFPSAFFHQTYIKFHRFHQCTDRNTFVVSVDHTALFLGELHRGKFIYPIRDPAVMPRIAARHHQIRRDKRFFPCVRNRLTECLPLRAGCV